MLVNFLDKCQLLYYVSRKFDLNFWEERDAKQ